MNTAVAPAAAPAKIRPMQTIVHGRVESTKLREKIWYSILVTPAEDSYSRPQNVEIRSKNKIGSQGEEITQLCKLIGFKRKPYTFTDKSTGEVLTLVPHDLVLEAVE